MAHMLVAVTAITREMTFIEHLEELRKRILWTLVSVAATARPRQWRPRHSEFAMEDDGRSFNPSYRPFLLALWPVTTLGVLGGLLARSGLPLRLHTVVLSLLGCLVLSVLVGFAAVESWRVVVSPRGLRAPDYAGREYLVEWSHIVTVCPVSFLGLKYLRVFSREARPVLWLPLFLTDMPGFRTALIQYADVGTPIADYFARHDISG